MEPTDLHIGDPPPPSALDVLLLTFAAGMLDAVTYLRSGVFTANMTGNTVILGLAVIGPDRSKAAPTMIALAAFAVGAVIAAIVLKATTATKDWTSDLAWGIALELPFLFSVAVLSLRSQPPTAAIKSWLIVLAACALGAQSVAVRRLKISGIVTTFITGSLTTGIVSLVFPQSRDSGFHSPPLLFGMFLCYIAAAATGAMLEPHKVFVAILPLGAVAAVEVRALASVIRRK